MDGIFGTILRRLVTETKFHDPPTQEVGRVFMTLLRGSVRCFPLDGLRLKKAIKKAHPATDGVGQLFPSLLRSLPPNAYLK